MSRIRAFYRRHRAGLGYLLLAIGTGLALAGVWDSQRDVERQGAENRRTAVALCVWAQSLGHLIDQAPAPERPLTPAQSEFIERTRDLAGRDPNLACPPDPAFSD